MHSNSSILTNVFADGKQPAGSFVLRADEDLQATRVGGYSEGASRRAVSSIVSRRPLEFCTF